MSDLHLGSQFSMHRQFRTFLRALPPGVTLVMNGDTVDAERKNIPPEHRELLSELCAESFRRRMVWTYGNHDLNFVPGDPHRIELAPAWSDGTIYFAHGDRFMPAYGLYRVFHRLVRIYRACGMRNSLATIRLAKRIPLLLRILKNGSVANAVQFAEKNGYKTVVCGHLHATIDVTVRGIRYINAGAWTDWPASYLAMDDGKIDLRQASA